MHTISLAICGVPITIFTCSPILTDFFAEYFRYYRPQVFSSRDLPTRSEASGVGINLELSILDNFPQAEGLIPPQARLFSQSGIGGLWREKIEAQGSSVREQFYFQMRCAVFRVDPEAGQIAGFISPCALECPHLLTDIYTLFPLLLLLRSRDVYHLQAAAVVSPGDKLWLICGAERTGKTTLTMALGLSGWRPISDDSLLVSFAASTARVTAFKKHFQVGDKLFERWPVLEGIRRGHRHLGRSWIEGLELFDTQELADAGFECVDYLVLPQIVGEPESSLQPIAGSEALLRLVEQSMFFQIWQLWRHRFEDQWRTLTDLTRNASCFRLFSGADLLEDPRRVADIFEQV